ncbi:Uncharacterised protein [Chlamydia trachomatis]|nr:Uncharacterised protein [Chlamydia trachomatis]
MLASVRLDTELSVLLVLCIDGFVQEWQDMWDWQRHMRNILWRLLHTIFIERLG